MPSRDLPDRPNLDQYRKQAKDLLKALRRGDADALARVRVHHPHPPARVTLADAQLVIAREHATESWPKFIAQIRSIAAPDAMSVWKAAERHIIHGDAAALDVLLRDYEALFRGEQPPPYVPRGPLPDYSTLDARAIVRHEHMFATWDEFVSFQAALKDRRSPVARFEAAAEAVVSGDIHGLRHLLDRDPDLIRARSTRAHRSTLLHYVGANGIEGWRQQTPRNAVAIAEALLDAGSEIDAVAEMYGGSRTLGLIATSIHPQVAGVQDELIELFITRGVAIGDSGAFVNDCLGNGRQGAAELLARRGAPLDLEGACGVGRLDIVESCFDANGQLRAPATNTRLERGFAWACEFGRAEVVAFLLDTGFDVATRLPHHRQTGLHWAAAGGHIRTVRVLLERGAPLDARDEAWNATPLRWAIHGWNESAPEDRSRYYDVIAALVRAGAAVEPEWLESVREDSRMMAALKG